MSVGPEYHDDHPISIERAEREGVLREDGFRFRGITEFHGRQSEIWLDAAGTTFLEISWAEHRDQLALRSVLDDGTIVETSSPGDLRSPVSHPLGFFRRKFIGHPEHGRKRWRRDGSAAPLPDLVRAHRAHVEHVALQAGREMLPITRNLVQWVETRLGRLEAFQARPLYVTIPLAALIGMYLAWTLAKAAPEFADSLGLSLAKLFLLAVILGSHRLIRQFPLAPSAIPGD